MGASASQRPPHHAMGHLALAVVVAMSVVLFGTANAAGEEAAATSSVRADQWIVIDADTGAVVAAHDARTPVRPASTIKLLTALVARQRLDAGQPIVISPVAASMPARRMGMPAGERWSRDDLLHAMLMASANDAAVALAEAVGGGDLADYEQIAAETARRLGLADTPFLPEPSGLDDEFAIAGGSLISARDMAIVARAVLAEPALRPMMVAERHDMVAWDGVGHYVIGHNRLLQRYPGAIGMKTGGTSAAGSTLVAAASRGGRTMVAVLFRSPNMYSEAATLLDIGFATPVAPAATAGVDRLPEVVPDAARFAVSAPEGAITGDVGVGDDGASPWTRLLQVVMVVAVAVAARRRQVVVRHRQRAAARRRHVSQRPRPLMLPELTR